MEKRPSFRNSGISSSQLLEWVRSTAPFLFEGDPKRFDPSQCGYALVLRDAANRPPDDSDLWGYFELCVSAHFATVGTFVPTDVDIAIREKLWSFVHSDPVFSPLWAVTRRFIGWNETPVSKRWVELDGSRLSGHQGEWLTVAMGAYGTAKRIGSEFLPEIREEIEREVDREEGILRELRLRFVDEPGVDSMKAYLGAVAAVAHNLGDLDRMFDAYSIEDTDVLKRRVYRSGHEDARNPRALFAEAGRVYQAILAAENHRNFALRTPKGLRKSERFLTPYGPFLDEWGEGIVNDGLHAGFLDEREFEHVEEDRPVERSIERISVAVT
ncbi:MAG: hypothetical protein EBX52_10845, partial [Proteobacteria bacterium]|nr:hypothetical protein [Pseudomonadota bacterium]